MSFLTIPFFVTAHVECSQTRQESHSEFADHQMHGDIFPRYLLDFLSSDNESLLWDIVYCKTLVFLPYIPKQKVTLQALYVMSRTKENNIMLWNVILYVAWWTLSRCTFFKIGLKYTSGTKQAGEHWAGPHLCRSYMPLYAQIISERTDNKLCRDCI